MADEPKVVPGHVGYSPDYKSEREPIAWGDQLIEQSKELANLRHMNRVQSEALISLRHTMMFWPPKDDEDAKLFDCSKLEIAREDVEAVQRILRERDTALEKVRTLAMSGSKLVATSDALIKKLIEERDEAREELRELRQRFAPEMDP